MTRLDRVVAAAALLFALPSIAWGSRVVVPGLSWERVVGAPVWVSGGTVFEGRVFEGRARGDGVPGDEEERAIFRLEFGESATFDVGSSVAIAWLPRGSARPDQIEAWRSSDGILFVQAEADFDGARAGTFRVPPFGGRFLQLRHAGSSRDPIEFELLRASPVEMGGSATETIELPGEAWTLRGLAEASDVAVEEGYRLLTPGSPWSIDVAGRRILRVETRYCFDQTDIAGGATYRVILAPPSGAPWFLEHSTGVSIDEGVWAEADSGRARAAVGVRRSDRIELDDGVDRLELTATGCVLVRLKGAAGERLLLPRRNGEPSRRDARPSVTNGRSLHDGGARGLASAAHGGGSGLPVAPDALNHSAWLGRDNRYRGAAEQALRVEEALRARVDAQTRAQLARDRDQASEWRSLVPHVQNDGEMRYRRIVPSIRFERDHATSAAPQRAPRILYRETLRQKASEIASGFFFEAPVVANAAHIYSVPASSDPVRLQLFVRGGVGATLTVRTGGGFEQRLEILDDRILENPISSGRPGETIPQTFRTPSTPEVAMALLSDAGVALDRPGGGQPLARAHRGFVELPASTREFGMVADRPGVEVAVRRYVDESFELSESEFLFWVEWLRERGWSATDLFRTLLATKPPTSSDAIEQVGLRSLWNHAIPLARYLRSKERKFAAGVRRLERVDFRCGGTPPEPADPMVVVTSWGRMGGGCAPDAATLEALVSALRELGTNEIADRFLAQSILYGGVEASDRAAELWDADRRQTGEAIEQVEAAASASVRRPTDENLVRLVDALQRLERWRWALWLATLIPEPLEESGSVARHRTPSDNAHDRSVPSEERVALAARVGWWRTFDEYVTVLDPIARQRWKSAREAANRIEGFGAGGAPELTTESGAAPQWINASWMVRGSAGGEEISLAHQLRPLQYFRASTSRPLRLRAPAGAELRLELRPVLSSAMNHASRLPVRVHRRGATESIVLERGDPSGDLSFVIPRLPGVQDVRSVGLREIVELSIDEAQIIQVEPAESEILIAVRARPAVAARTPGVVPVLEESSVDAASVCVVGVERREAPRCFSRAEARLEPEAPLAWRSRTAATTVDPTVARFRELLRSSEATPQQRSSVLAAAHALWHDAGRPPVARGAYERVIDGSAWRRLSTVQSSAGVRDVEGVGWRPESPQLRVKRALFGELEDSEIILGAGHELVSEWPGREPVDLRVSLAVLAVPPFEAFPVGASVHIDGAPTRRVLLDSERPTVDLSIPLAANARTVRVAFDEPRVQHYLKVRIDGRSAGTSYQPQLRSWRRGYDVSSAEAPLRMRVHGPAWIRVDEWVDDRTVSNYQTIDKAGWQTVDFPPSRGRTKSLYRVFERVAESADEPKRSIAPSRGRRAIAAVEALGSAWPENTSIELPADRAIVRPAGERVSTQSFELGVRSRRLVDEDLAAAEDREEFVEGRWTYRRRLNGLEGGRRFVEGGFVGRARDRGEPTFGLFGHLRHEPASSPWVASLDARGYAQEMDSAEWAVRVDAAVARTFDWGDRTTSRLRLNAFFRELSLDGVPRSVSLATIDQDIFTEYKDGHRDGAELAFSTTHSPYRDFQLFTALSARSNESVADIDRAEAQLGFRQLIGGLRLDLRYRYARFFEDEDRVSDFDRDRLTLSGAWERWDPNRNRWELGGAISYDIEGEELSGRLVFSRHLSRDRMLEDFRPVAAGFTSLRERRASRFETP